MNFVTNPILNSRWNNSKAPRPKLNKRWRRPLFIRHLNLKATDAYASNRNSSSVVVRQDGHKDTGCSVLSGGRSPRTRGGRRWPDGNARSSTPCGAAAKGSPKTTRGRSQKPREILGSLNFSGLSPSKTLFTIWKFWDGFKENHQR